MDAIQGAGSTGYGVRPVVHAAGEPNKTERRPAEEIPGDTTCMGAALRLSRNYLTLALQDTGFVDIRTGVSSGDDAKGHFAMEVEVAEPDMRTAGEIAASFSQQVAGNSIEQMLEMLERPDTKYVLKLLKS